MYTFIHFPSFFFRIWPASFHNYAHVILNKKKGSRRRFESRNRSRRAGKWRRSRWRRRMRERGSKERMRWRGTKAREDDNKAGFAQKHCFFLYALYSLL